MLYLVGNLAEIMNVSTKEHLGQDTAEVQVALVAGPGIQRHLLFIASEPPLVAA